MAPDSLAMTIKHMPKPGPGSYNESLKPISRQPASYSIRPRINGTSPNRNVGPGSYSPQQRAFSPSFSMRSRTSDQKQRFINEAANVGPGKYDAPSSIKQNSGFTIGERMDYRGVNGFC